MHIKPYRHSRFTGPVVVRANEADSSQGGAPDNEVTFYDADGNVCELPNAGQFQLLPADGARAHASSASALMTNQRLTNFSSGLPNTPIDDLVDFLAPRVEVPIMFDYVIRDKSSERAVLQSDLVGADGMPPVVVRSDDATTSGKLLNRGAETPFTWYDQQIAAGNPGDSVERQRQRRTRFVLNAIRRGRASRVVAAAAAAAGAATVVTIAADADPIAAFKTYIALVAAEIESREYVRVLMGDDTWNSLTDHALLVGGTNYPRQDVTEAKVATMLGIRPENFKVSLHRAETAKQGKTSSRDTILGGNQVYIYGCYQQPDEDDPSFLKTFNMRMSGEGWYEVYIWPLGPHGERIGVRYFELVKATNSSAVQRLAVTFS